jgi:hypothetical protein
MDERELKLKPGENIKIITTPFIDSTKVMVISRYGKVLDEKGNVVGLVTYQNN